MGFFGALVKELRFYERNSNNYYDKQSLQSSSNRFFSAIYHDCEKDFNIGSTSDDGWINTCNMLSALYRQDIPNHLEIPSDLNATFINRILQKKTRVETQACIRRMADALGIKLD
jgi:hypothetical protein